MSYLKGSGNALAEYALPLGVFLAAGLLAASLIDLPNAIQTSFANTMNGRHDGNTSLTVARFGGERGPWMGGTPVVTENVCFNSGVCINLPVVAASGTVAETAGSMGGELTGAFANALQQLATQIAASPANDPDFVALITKLANQGHAIGNDINAMDDLLWTYRCDIRICNESNMDPNGTFRQLNDLSYNVNEARLSKFKADYAMLQNYLATNPSVLSSFPEAEVIIQIEAEQIQVLAEAIPTACAAGSCTENPTTPTTAPYTIQTSTHLNPDTGQTT